MSRKHYFASMRIAEKVAIGKSADISQNVQGIFLLSYRSFKNTVEVNHIFKDLAKCGLSWGQTEAAGQDRNG